VGSFPGGSWEKWARYAATMGWLSNALTFAAIGILIGLVSSSFHRYLQGSLEAIAGEMEIAILDLAVSLRAVEGRSKPGESRPIRSRPSAS
jgi:hypothetical protein